MKETLIDELIFDIKHDIGTFETYITDMLDDNLTIDTLTMQNIIKETYLKLDQLYTLINK